MPRNLSETDRKKNQFDKVERVHLLSLMNRYAPQLDKSTSTLARRKIWTTIEDEFRKMVFTRKTSAQLKKYWQNYKYHCKKAKELAKDSEWNRHRVQIEIRPESKFSDVQQDTQPSSETPDWPRDTVQEDGCSSLDVIDLSCVKMEKEEAACSDHDSPEGDELDERKEISGLEDHSTDCKTRNRVVVSSASISDNSVTVSVLYPDANDRSSKEELQSCTADVLWQPREQRRTCEDSSDSQNASKGQQTDCNEERGGSSNHGIRPDELARRILPASAPVENGESSTAVVPTKRDAVERNESIGSKIFVTNYPNQLKHRLLLQHLETEEKRLKVKIAEMGVQEVQLRIKAVHEDMRRTEELHRLNLARAAAGNVNF